MKVLGIDPGNSGALALIDTEACTLAVVDMPLEVWTKGRSITSASGLGDILRHVQPDQAFVEHVGVRPGEGAVGAFSFGRGLGRIEGVLATLLAPLWLIRPAEWKGKTNTPADKKQAVTRAEQLFPSAKSVFRGPKGGVKDGRAEAAILAFFGCLKLGMTPSRPLKLVEFPECVVT